MIRNKLACLLTLTLIIPCIHPWLLYLGSHIENSEALQGVRTFSYSYSSDNIRIAHKHTGVVYNSYRGHHLRVMGISSQTGWRDPYFELAARWAPVIYQDTDSSFYKGDYITSFDFDGDWIGNNNWENLDYYNQIYAYVYYAVIETTTHYFIFYMFFHPRDWDDIPLPILMHENDMEGVMVVVTKDGSSFGSFLLMETRAHFDFYQYTNDPRIGSGTDNVDGPVILQNGRPTVFIEAKGHGVYAWSGSEFPGGDGVVYYYYNNQTDYPTSGNDRDVKYALVPIIRTLWPRRYSIGNGLTYDQPFIYSGARFSFQAAIGGAFDGDTYMPDSANPPWGMDDGNDGPVYKGDWFFDPAYTVGTHLSIPYSFSLNYVYNPYLIESGPEWIPPQITLNSPVVDNYYSTRSILMDFHVSDSYDLYILTVTVNGSVVYTSKSRGRHSFVYNASTDGAYLVTIMAVDIWGNYRNVSFQFFVDTTKPTIETTIVNGSWIADSSMNFYWYATDNFGISRVAIFLNGIKIVERSAGSGFESIYFSSEGRHEIALEAYDLASNPNRVKYLVRVDWSPPVLTIVSPEDNTITLNNSIILRWESFDSVYLFKHEVYLNDQLLATLSNLTRQFTISNVPEGIHRVRVVAYDYVQHVTSREIIVRVDRTPPTLTVSLPQNNSLVPMRFNVTWYASDNMGISRIRLFLDGSLYAELGASVSTYEVTLNTGGLHTIKVVVYDLVGLSSEKAVIVYCDVFPPVVTIHVSNATVFRTDFVFISWSVQEDYGIAFRYVIVDNFDVIPVYRDNITLALNDGPHLICVRVTDNAGNVGEARITIFVDTRPPSVVITSPANDSYFSQPTILISWHASDQCGIVRSEVYINNVVYYPQGNSIIVELSTEGRYTITVVVFDYAGYSARSKVTITIDFTPPTLIVYSPANYSKHAGSINVEWMANDALSGIARIRILVNNSLVGEFASSSGSKAISLTCGFYIITVEAIDRAGNSKRVEICVFVACLQIVDPENNANVSLRTIGLVIRAVYVSKIKVYMNSSYVATFDIGQQIILEMSKEGLWIIRVVDADQPQINASVSIRADWTAPVVSISNLPNYLNVSRLRVSWSAHDNGSGVKEFELYLNSVKYWSGKSNSLWITLSEGVWNITVVAIDFAGNKRSSWCVVVVDLTPPMVVLSITDGTVFREVYVSIGWNSVDNLSGVAEVAVYLNGVFQGLYGACDSINFMLKNGQYRITLIAKDRAGNQGYATAVFSVSAPPVILVYGPKNNSYVANSTVSFSWNLFNGQIQEQKVYLNNVELTVSGTSITLKGLTDGTYNLTVVIRSAGGELLKASVIFYVDTTAPELEILEPANSSYINKSSIDIRISYSDNFGIAGMSVLVNGTLLELPPTGNINLDLEEGYYIIIIRVHDYAGNYIERALELTVDLTSPIIRIIEPENNTQTNSTEITIIWHAADNFGIDRIEIWLNGTLVAVLPGGASNYTILLNSTVLVRVVVYDLAGNSACDEILVCFLGHQNDEATQSHTARGGINIGILFLALILLVSMAIIWKNRKQSSRSRKFDEEFETPSLLEVVEELDKLFGDKL